MHTLSITRSRREICTGSFGAQFSQQLHIERKIDFHTEKKEMRFNKASSNVLEKNIPFNNAGKLLTKVIVFFLFCETLRIRTGHRSFSLQSTEKI
jgi:hypothetical protein